MEDNGFEEIGYIPLTRPYGTAYNPKKWAGVLDFTRAYLTKLGKEATIRFLYYRLIEESGLKIPPTTDTYESYITTIANARKDYKNPDNRVLVQKIFDDTRGRYTETFYDWVNIDEETLKYNIELALTSTRRIYPYDKYVELWFEDTGMWHMYKDIAKKYRISTECIRGNLIVNTVYGSYNRINQNAYDKKKKITILYVGDFNPSGNRRPFNIKAALQNLGLFANVKKVLVTKPQLKGYDIIPDIKSPKTQERIEKAKRDPLMKWFIENYGTDVYDVNAEAMDYPDVEDLVTKAIKEQVDTSKLDDLDEERPIEHEVEWDEDGYYKIKMDRLS